MTRRPVNKNYSKESEFDKKRKMDNKNALTILIVFIVLLLFALYMTFSDHVFFFSSWGIAGIFFLSSWFYFLPRYNRAVGKLAKGYDIGYFRGLNPYAFILRRLDKENKVTSVLTYILATIHIVGIVATIGYVLVAFEGLSKDTLNLVTMGASTFTAFYAYRILEILLVVLISHSAGLILNYMDIKYNFRYVNYYRRIETGVGKKATGAIDGASDFWQYLLYLVPFIGLIATKKAISMVTRMVELGPDELDNIRERVIDIQEGRDSYKVSQQAGYEVGSNLNTNKEIHHTETRQNNYRPTSQPVQYDNDDTDDFDDM